MRLCELLHDAPTGLTPYDMVQTPLVLPDDDPASTITMEVRKLNVELTCVVCRSIILDCRTVRTCLHRFCASCIATALRFGYACQRVRRGRLLGVKGK